MRLKLIIAVLVFLTTICSADQRPNVVLIVADGLSYGDFGFTGNPVIPTPRLDALAVESGQLTAFYVSPVCSPARANLMTGMKLQEASTFLELLQPLGYATESFGSLPQRPSVPITNDKRRDTDEYFDSAIMWFEKQANESKPFSAVITTDRPLDLHTETLARVREIDKNVGKLVNALENAGIKENTIVIFLIESGGRSPLLFHWPNRLNGGNRFDGVCANIDVVPTILEACGAKAPVKFDGRSFLAALEGTNPSWPERDLLNYKIRLSPSN